MCDCPRYSNENERWVAHTVSCRIQRNRAAQMAMQADAQRRLDKQKVNQMLANLTPADVMRMLKGGK